MLDTILTIAGIFAGIGVFLATMYSVAQILMTAGRHRLAHALQLGLILAVMAALIEREVGLGRLLAVPLAAVALWVFAIERGWFRVFPALVQIFALILVLGYVALTPLPA